MRPIMESHANGVLVSSPRGATRCGSFRADPDISVCNLEATARTGGGVQGKTCTSLHRNAIFLKMFFFKGQRRPRVFCTKLVT